MYPIRVNYYSVLDSCIRMHAWFSCSVAWGEGKKGIGTPGHVSIYVDVQWSIAGREEIPCPFLQRSFFGWDEAVPIILPFSYTVSWLAACCWPPCSSILTLLSPQASTPADSTWINNMHTVALAINLNLLLLPASVMKNINLQLV